MFRAAQKLAKAAWPHDNRLSLAMARISGAQSGCRMAVPCPIESMTPANLRAARNRLRRLAQVLWLTPCAAGRIFATMALMAGASAGNVAGADPTISQLFIRVIHIVLDRLG
jgi:hypothetical protein